MHLRLALSGLRFAADPLRGVILYQRAGSMSSGHRIDCTRAAIAVLGEAIAATGTKYRVEAGARLWKLAAQAAGYDDWEYVRKALELIKSAGYSDPHEEHWAIRVAARVNPYGAVWAREAFIRSLKPHLRRDMPRYRRDASAGDARNDMARVTR
jgi:hypothetical protein